MEFKRCPRCGNFFVSNNNICCNCQVKDRADIAKLNNILDSSSNINSINELSANSGVNPSNINRFIEDKFISL
ncbi:MAG: hypothetical protein ACI4VP_04850 [Clostridia bacterium]